MRAAAVRTASTLLVLLLALAAPPAGAGVLRRGPEPFSAKSLAAWEGRIVRRIDDRGRRITRPHVVAREIETRVGQPLDLQVLEMDLQRLQNISIFSDVRVEAQEAEDGGVALTFVLKESPWIIPFPTFTYTEENGFSGGVGVSAMNLRGRSLRLSGSALFGGTTQYRVGLDSPWLFGDHHQSANVFLAHRERPDELRGFAETSNELTAHVGRYLGRQGRSTLDFTWLRMGSDVPGITLTPDNQDDLLRLGFTVGWDSRDSWRNPRRGWKNEVAFRGTGGFLGGDGDSVAVDVDVRRWTPFGERQKLLTSGLLTMQSGTLGVDVPVYLDYYIGGANSVRGYTVDQLGTAFSGKNQLLGTAEYSFQLMPVRRWDVSRLSFAVGAELTVFADAGIAWSQGRQFAMNRARGGVGTGFRLLFPGTEMVRFDVGWSPEGGFQFHFAGGTKPNAQRNRLR